MQTEARVGVVVEGGQRDGCTRKLVQVQQAAQIGTVSQLLAGGIAGAVSKTCTAPLARLTILFQVQGMHSDTATLRKACIWREATRIVHEEGIRAFWKGNLVTIAHRLPYSSVSFYSYEKYKNLLQSFPGLESNRDNISAHLFVRLTGGFLAGITAATATYPLDLVRTRLAAQTNVIYYKGIWHALRTISKDEGIFGLYKGLGATLLSVGPNIAISFSVYETLRSLWQSQRPHDSSALVSLACGSVSGIASSTVIFPLDLMRRRMQLEGAGGRARVYKTGLSGAFSHIIRTEGLRGLYRGIIPEYYKVVPSVSIVFMTYEMMKKLLSNYPIASSSRTSVSVSGDFHLLPCVRRLSPGTLLRTTVNSRPIHPALLANSGGFFCKFFIYSCKTHFTWDPQLDAEVKRQWKKLASKRLKDMVAKAAKEPMDKLITWMSDNIRRSLKRMRETDEEFKKRSQRNRKNKVEGPKAKIGHSQGSISSTMWFNKLAKALKRRPSASELFAATHSKVDSTGRRVWCDVHAQGVYEKYEQLKAGKDVQVGSDADDQIFYEACGGWSNKGSIYGLGREGPSLFPRQARCRGSTAAASSSYSSPLVTQLQDQLQTTQNELQVTQSRLHSTEDELRTTKEQLATAMKQLEDQRIGLLELHARFDSFSALLGHPTTRGGNSFDSS